jgi:hypothetical protein
MSSQSHNSSGSVNSLSTTDGGSRQRSQNRSNGSRANEGKSRKGISKSQSTSLSDDSAENDESSSDEEENEEDYRPGKCFFINYTYVFQVVIIVL